MDHHHRSKKSFVTEYDRRCYMNPACCSKKNVLHYTHRFNPPILGPQKDFCTEAIAKGIPIRHCNLGRAEERIPFTASLKTDKLETPNELKNWKKWCDIWKKNQDNLTAKKGDPRLRSLMTCAQGFRIKNEDRELVDRTLYQTQLTGYGVKNITHPDGIAPGKRHLDIPETLKGRYYHKYPAMEKLRFAKSIRKELHLPQSDPPEGADEYMLKNNLYWKWERDWEKSKYLQETKQKLKYLIAEQGPLEPKADDLIVQGNYIQTEEEISRNKSSSTTRTIPTLVFSVDDYGPFTSGYQRYEFDSDTGVSKYYAETRGPVLRIRGITQELLLKLKTSEETNETVSPGIETKFFHDETEPFSATPRCKQTRCVVLKNEGTTAIRYQWLRFPPSKAMRNMLSNPGHFLNLGDSMENTKTSVDLLLPLKSIRAQDGRKKKPEFKRVKLYRRIDPALCRALKIMKCCATANNAYENLLLMIALRVPRLRRKLLRRTGRRLMDIDGHIVRQMRCQKLYRESRKPCKKEKQNKMSTSSFNESTETDKKPFLQNLNPSAVQETSGNGTGIVDACLCDTEAPKSTPVCEFVCAVVEQITKEPHDLISEIFQRAPPNLKKKRVLRKTEPYRPKARKTTYREIHEPYIPFKPGCLHPFHSFKHSSYSEGSSDLVTEMQSQLVMDYYKNAPSTPPPTQNKEDTEHSVEISEYDIRFDEMIEDNYETSFQDDEMAYIAKPKSDLKSWDNLQETSEVDTFGMIGEDGYKSDGENPIYSELKGYKVTQDYDQQHHRATITVGKLNPEESETTSYSQNSSIKIPLRLTAETHSMNTQSLEDDPEDSEYYEVEKESFEQQVSHANDFHSETNMPPKILETENQNIMEEKVKSASIQPSKQSCLKEKIISIDDPVELHSPVDESTSNFIHPFPKPHRESLPMTSAKPKKSHGKEPKFLKDACFDFHFRELPGILLPGQTIDIPIIFRPRKPGYYYENLYLLTHPRLSDDSDRTYTVRLTGICMEPDCSLCHKDKTKEKQRLLEPESVKRSVNKKMLELESADLMDSVLDHALYMTTPPKASLPFGKVTAESIFYTHNPNLHYHYGVAERALSTVRKLITLLIPNHRIQENSDHICPLSIQNLYQQLWNRVSPQDFFLSRFRTTTTEKYLRKLATYSRILIRPRIFAWPSKQIRRNIACTANMSAILDEIFTGIDKIDETYNNSEVNNILRNSIVQRLKKSSLRLHRMKRQKEMKERQKEEKQEGYLRSNEEYQNQLLYNRESGLQASVRDSTVSHRDANVGIDIQVDGHTERHKKHQADHLTKQDKNMTSIHSIKSKKESNSSKDEKTRMPSKDLDTTEKAKRGKKTKEKVIVETKSDKKSKKNQKDAGGKGGKRKREKSIPKLEYEDEKEHEKDKERDEESDPEEDETQEVEVSNHNHQILLPSQPKGNRQSFDEYVLAGISSEVSLQVNKWRTKRKKQAKLIFFENLLGAGIERMLCIVDSMKHVDDYKPSEYTTGDKNCCAPNSNS